jgi:hypothetical protein
MHGSASALVGVALGRFRFGRGLTRLASLVIGMTPDPQLRAELAGQVAEMRQAVDRLRREVGVYGMANEL